VPNCYLVDIICMLVALNTTKCIIMMDVTARRVPPSVVLEAYLQVMQ